MEYKTIYEYKDAQTFYAYDNNICEKCYIKLDYKYSSRK